MTAPARPSSVPAHLCVGCAMCCNGTLYGRAKVASGEERRIVDAGLELVTGEEKNYFRLPCRFESCGQCTIYETRFAVCRSFQCALLKRVEAGEIDLDSASSIVAKAQELLRTVVAGDPDAATNRGRAEIRARLAEEINRPPDSNRHSAAQRLLNIIALDTYLERWFRTKKSEAQEAGVDSESASNS